MFGFRRALQGALLTGGAMLLAAASAQAITYAKIDAPGPALSVPTASLQSALSCTGNLASSAHEPILLIAEDTLTPAIEYTWNWEPQLTKLGWPYCTLTLPGHGMGDIQTSGEYVVHALRTMSATSGKKVNVLGHNLGAVATRWALRFWPDTRPMVDDLISAGAMYHGSIAGKALCALTCAPVFWQLTAGSNFLAALNSGQETFPGISYTDIYTRTDETILENDIGNDPTSALSGGGGQVTTIAVQQRCPLDVADHAMVGTTDNVAYALTIDALTHAGPADPARIPSSVCLDPLMPGVNPLTVALNVANASAVFIEWLATYPHTSTEPALACYVTANCPAHAVRARIGRIANAAQ